MIYDSGTSKTHIIIILLTLFSVLLPGCGLVPEYECESEDQYRPQMSTIESSTLTQLRSADVEASSAALQDLADDWEDASVTFNGDELHLSYLYEGREVVEVFTITHRNYYQ